MTASILRQKHTTRTEVHTFTMMVHSPDTGIVLAKGDMAAAPVVTITMTDGKCTDIDFPGATVFADSISWVKAMAAIHAKVRELENAVTLEFEGSALHIAFSEGGVPDPLNSQPSTLS